MSFLRRAVAGPERPETGAAGNTGGRSFTAGLRSKEEEQELPSAGGSYATPEIDWKTLVAMIQEARAEGLDQLYRLFARGIRYHLCRQLGPQELDDKVHDTFLIVVQAIQKGDLREPERLMGFVRTIVRRQIALYIHETIQKRHDQVDLDTGVRLSDSARNPEQRVITQETRILIERVLDRMNSRDREILTRFYLYEQTQEQICDEMELTDTQFRLLKSRAKARFGEIGKKNLAQRDLGALFVRTFLSAMH